jgi:hypothetical protein
MFFLKVGKLLLKLFEIKYEGMRRNITTVFYHNKYKLFYQSEFFSLFGHKTTESGYGFGLAGSRSETWQKSVFEGSL